MRFRTGLRRLEIEYFDKLEFGRGGVHNHYLLRRRSEMEPAEVRLVATRAADSLGLSITTYVAPIRRVNAICRYIAKDTGNPSQIVPPPPSFRGRTITYSRGYLAAPMRALRLEVWARWYPAQRAALVDITGGRPDVTDFLIPYLQASRRPDAKAQVEA